MAVEIRWNRARGTMTSGIWNVIERPCRTTLAPIFTSLARSVLIDHCLTSSGSASVRRKLARLQANPCNCIRTAFALKLWQDSGVQVTAFLSSLIHCDRVPLRGVGAVSAGQS